MMDFLYKILRVIRGSKSFAGSAPYWESRYKTGGTSGGGSYGRLAKYKADFLNAFTEKNSIRSAVEWGCGDGHQASLLKVPSYLGLDISQTAIAMCRKKFAGDASKRFELNEAYTPHHQKELAMSLDVLYHLVEDDVYEAYMHQLFSSASRFVIIYSCNFDDAPTANHVRPRKFTDFTNRNFAEWKMIYTEENPYPMTVMNDPETSWSMFFVFRKMPI